MGFVEGAKRDASKEARMQSIKDGREDQDQHKMKNRIKENQVGTGTNKQKGKKKAFTMVKHKLNATSRNRNFTDKMLRMRNALQNRRIRSINSSFREKNSFFIYIFFIFQ